MNTKNERSWERKKSRKNVCFLCFTFLVYSHFVPLFSHSGFCLNVLNQNLEILKSVNFQYAHCVRSCVSAVIVISLFSLTFTYFFVHRFFLSSALFSNTHILSNKVVIKQNLRFCFVQKTAYRNAIFRQFIPRDRFVYLFQASFHTNDQF